jgi:hypothetical protein
LILTDGVIDDMDETKMEIISSAGTAPMSVIIVGIGEEDFSDMVELDANKEDGQGNNIKLTFGDEMAERDIVRFVEFKRFEDGDQEALADEVLKEVPRQVVSFYESRKIKPANTD